MKYSKEKTDEICKYLRNGHERVELFVNRVISETQFYKWMSGGVPERVLRNCKNKEEKEKKRAEFAESIKKAEKYGKKVIKAEAKQSIRDAMSKHWTAAAWWLERKHPEEFRERKELDHLSGGKSLIMNIPPSQFVKKKKKK